MSVGADCTSVVGAARAQSGRAGANAWGPATSAISRIESGKHPTTVQTLLSARRGTRDPSGPWDRRRGSPQLGETPGIESGARQISSRSGLTSKSSTSSG